MAWTYVNVKVPMATATMETDESIRELLQIFGVDADEWSDASTGHSANGPWDEGDVWDSNGNELLLYDFIEVDGAARIFRRWKTEA